MPPVLGPVSPSPTRLKSCAGASGTTVAAVGDAEQRHLGPVEVLLDDDAAARPVEAPRARGPAPALSSSVTTTPLPAASPSSLTTYGGPKARERRPRPRQRVVQTRARAVGTPAAAITSLAKALLPSSRAARGRRPEAGDPAGPDGVRDPGHERRLGPDDDEVGGRARRRGRRRPRGAATSTRSAHGGVDPGVPGGDDDRGDGRVGAAGNAPGRAHGHRTRRRGLSRRPTLVARRPRSGAVGPSQAGCSLVTKASSRWRSSSAVVVWRSPSNSRRPSSKPAGSAVIVRLDRVCPSSTARSRNSPT